MSTPSLRARLASGVRPLRLLEAHDGLSAHVVAHARGRDGTRFDGLWIGSFADALSRAQPDEEIVDLGTRIDALAWTLAASDLPALFDADGGGEPEQAASLVRRLARIGVAGVVIEDKIGRKRNSLRAPDGREIQAPLEWFCDKLRAAVQARGHHGLMVVARLETLVLGGTAEQAIERARAYARAGADALMIHCASADPSEMFATIAGCRQVGLELPIVAVPTAYPHVDEHELVARGVDVVVYANQLVRSAIVAMRATAAALLEQGRAAAAEPGCAPMGELLEQFPLAMITADEAIAALREAGIELFVGVPDSTLPGLDVAALACGAAHIGAVNEGSAVGIAAGHALARAQPACVYLQNAGLGVALDAWASLAGDDALAVPMVWLVGWRGHPDAGDPPHHRVHGELTPLLLVAAGIEVHELDTVEQLRTVLGDARQRRGGVAFLVRPGLWSATRAPLSPQRGLGRREAIGAVLDGCDARDRIVVGVGYMARELADLRRARSERADDVLANGGMGHAAGLGLGLALAQRERRVVVIDGDGALAMHMGTLASIAALAPASFVHVVLDNGCHESVGGPPSVWAERAPGAIAEALGYRRIEAPSDAAALRVAVAMRDSAGPTLVHVRTASRRDPVPPRPPEPGRPSAPSLLAPRLYTPGPGRLSWATKHAMLFDTGSRTAGFVARTREVCERTRELVADDGYACVPLAGSATTGLEAVLECIAPARVLALVNGAYGTRLATLAAKLGHTVTLVEDVRGRPFDPAKLREQLGRGVAFELMLAVHGETSTGVLNPIEELCRIAVGFAVPIVLDVTSTAGAVPIDLTALRVDAAVTSSAKLIEGPPGLALVVARRSWLERADARHGLVHDLAAQWRRLQHDGQFRFTPPCHIVLGLASALGQLHAQGGAAARLRRYVAVADAIEGGLAELGLRAVVPREHRLPAVLVVRAEHAVLPPFESLQRELSARGLEIYPPVLADEAAFRIGLVGVALGDVPPLLHALAQLLGHSQRK